MKWLHLFKIPLTLIVVGAITFTAAWMSVQQPQAVNVADAPTPNASVQGDVPPTDPSAESIDSAPIETVPLGSPANRRGVYLTAHAAANTDLLNRTISRSLEFGYNALVIDVKDNSGTLAYDSEIPLAQQIGAVLPRYDLKQMVELLHKKGIYFIARLVVFSDPKLAKHFGSQDEWVLASNAQAVAYNLAVAEEVAAAGVDEIQFDYIRFPDEGSIGENYAGRSAAVASFLQQANALVGNHVHLSADVFGRTLWDWNPKGIDPIGQVLEQMGPSVDYLSPMIYPSHYEKYFQDRPYEVVHRGVSVGLERGLQLRPYLQSFDMRIPSGMSYTHYIREQLRALKELGVRGYLWWNPRGDYSDLWAALSGR